MTDDEFSQWDAAYVLGVLSVNERHAFERHFSACSSCQGAVSELAPLPGLLAALPAPSAARATDAGARETPVIAADARSLTTLAARVHHRRRTSRMQLAAAAVGLVFLGAGAGLAISTHVETTTVPTAETVSMRLDPVDDSGVHADLTLIGNSWGTRLEWSCDYPAGLAPGHVYELIVTDADGIRTVVSTWTGDGGARTVGLSAATATPGDEITRIELTALPSGTLLAATDH